MKVGKLAAKIGMKLAQSRAKNDPEFLADITKAALKKYFRQITGEDLLDYYKNKKNLTELIGSNMNKLTEFADKISLDTKDIKELIDQHMTQFEISWIKIWWKEDHKHLYAALMNQPKEKQEDMENWIVEQVQNIAKELTSKL